MAINCNQHLEESKTQLKTGGLKVTSARLDLLDIFKHAKKPLSIKETAKHLSNANIDLVTLYRNVDSLEDLGIIKQVRLNNKQSYYEVSSHKHHHHLVCTICGKITDVEGCKISVADKNFAKNNGFAKVTEHSLEFFGICNSCYKK